MNYILYVLVFIFIITIVVTIYIFTKQNKYTKERFAFFAVSSMFSLSTIVIAHIFADKSLLILLIEIVNSTSILNSQLSIPQTDWSSKILSVLILLIYSIFIYAMFDIWDGKKSQNEKNIEDTYNKLKLLDAAFYAATNFNIKFCNKDKDKNKKKEEDLGFFQQNQGWHIDCMQLLKLNDNQYKINLENDWFKERGFFISKYASSDILILCSINEINKLKINSDIDFVQKTFPDVNIKRVLVLIKNSSDRKTSYKYNNIFIEYRYELDILSTLVDFNEYFEYIISKFEKKEISKGDGLTLKDTYVSSSGLIYDYFSSKEKNLKNIQDYVLDWANSSKNNKHLSIIGEYGQGKSVLSLKIAYEMIKSKNARIPIIIELRGKSPKNLTILELIATWATNFNINPNSIERLLYAGKLLIILEGFDEMDLGGNSYYIKQHFDRLWEFARYENTKLIITGRPNLFLDNYELNKQLHSNPKTNQLFYSEVIRIIPFNKNQIFNSLRNFNKNIREEISDLFSKEENKNFLDLISRPSTLYQAAVIWNEIDKDKINSASIIEKFIKHSYHRQNKKLTSIGNTGIEPVLTVSEREYFMIGIAVGMIKLNTNTNTINKNSLYQIVVNLYESIPKEVSDGKELLQNRLSDMSEKIEIVFNDVRTSGIIVIDFNTPGSFKFAHKSFLEFLFSFYFSQYLLEEDEYYLKIMNSINNALNIKDIYNLHYSNDVIDFIATQLLDSKGYDEKNEITKYFFKIIFKNNLIQKYYKLLINKNRLIRGIITLSLIPVMIIILLLNKNNQTMTLSIIIFLSYILLFIMNKFSPKRHEKALKIWHKTCKSAIKEEAKIYEMINKDIFNQFNEETNKNLKKEVYKILKNKL